MIKFTYKSKSRELFICRQYREWGRKGDKTRRVSCSQVTNILFANGIYYCFPTNGFLKYGSSAFCSNSCCFNYSRGQNSKCKTSEALKN